MLLELYNSIFNARNMNNVRSGYMLQQIYYGGTSMLMYWVPEFIRHLFNIKNSYINQWESASNFSRCG